jgi:hypothetical protein
MNGSEPALAAPAYAERMVLDELSSPPPGSP